MNKYIYINSIKRNSNFINMGSCYSVHHMYKNSDKKECFICWEEITEVYVKCRICNTILHEICALRYIHNLQQCPNCNRKKSLFLYKNGLCTRLKYN